MTITEDYTDLHSFDTEIEALAFTEGFEEAVSQYDPEALCVGEKVEILADGKRVYIYNPEHI